MLRRIVPSLALIGLIASLTFAQQIPPVQTIDLMAETAVAPLLQQAQASVQRGDFKAAISLLEQALQQQSQHKAARKALIQLLMRQARTQEAADHIETFARFYPTDTEPVFLRAALAFQNGQIPQAATFAQQCLERGDKRAEVYKLLAICEYLQQQYEKFELHINAAAKQNPLDADPHYHLGRYFFENKRYAEALTRFTTVFKLQPDHFKAHYYAGLVYEGQNQLEQAKQAYQTAIGIIDKLKIRYAWPFAELGKLLVNEDDYERGLGWFYRAVRNDPDSPYAHYGYAKALFRKEATSEVKDELLTALKLDPGYADALYLLARYYQKTGAEQLAKDTFTKFEEIKKNPMPSPFGVRRW
ncbi:MAG TPA: tetratricopeptide repeat protein [Blastocatellia bacterium]|nr:tetratricopeptide repeat protein [Blastocatellia bacterium]